jgi:transcriptional regulator with XRE-family HTH domain
VANRPRPDPLAQLAVNVKRIRDERGLTQEEVANRGELSISDVGRVERGQRDPGIGVLARIAYGLAVPPADLLWEVSWVPGRAGPKD